MKEVPKLSWYEASTRGAVTVDQNSAQLNDVVRRNRAAVGINTIKLRYMSVKPIDKPKPGRMLRCLRIMVRDFFRALPSRLIDLIKRSAVGKMCLLGFFPTPKHFVDGEKVHPRKLFSILLSN